MNPFAGTKSSEEMKSIYLKSLGKDYGEFTLGQNTTKILHEDPKMLLFMLSRHKFVAKMFSGFNKVLEIGCQEGFGSMLVAQAVGQLTAVDFYLPYIESSKRRIKDDRISFGGHDMLDSPVDGDFDGAFALDVLEHINQEDEDLFMKNILGSLSKDGCLILGMPSLESQKHASEASKLGHVNCKNGKDFSLFGKKYFKNVFSFSMNDEVLHTGFFPMSQYLFILCCNKRTDLS
jgi:2-polyprenyl-3-methyl-5-hydroxy-6-metoxy-1,4-benzoquinol methylase